jgi:hypothetical protein
MTRSRPFRAISILPFCLLFLLLFHSGSRAKEGFCRGDQERARILFEALNFRLDAMAEEGIIEIRRAARAGFHWAARLSMWLIHAETWQLLSAGLEDPGYEASRMQSLLRKSWLRAWQIAAAIDRRNPGMEDSLKKAVGDALASHSVCRSISVGHAEPCARLAQLNGGKSEECTALFVNFGILYSHRCEAESVYLAAWLLGIQFQDVLDWCDILARGAEEKCRLGGDQSPHELAGCRAMATRDENGCRAPGMTPQQTTDCLGKLRTYRYVLGELPEGQWRPWMYDPMFESAVSTARNGPGGSRSCLDRAYRAYLRTSALIFWLPEHR